MMVVDFSMSGATAFTLCTDWGEISIGKRADLVRVRHTAYHPLIRSVWREGRRIA